MQGKEVFRHAVEKLSETAETALRKAGLTADDVDWIVPHQANLRIITRTAQKMGVGMDRVVVTVQDHGNTSAASIPLALSVAVGDGRINEGRPAGGRGHRRRPGLGLGRPALVAIIRH
jgi:3-oxoacyl-[acyl-carrier-protein] synthase-3